MIETGEIITLSNNKEYICFSSLDYEGRHYICLISDFKPLEIKFGIQTIENNEISIEIINDQKEKEKVLSLFQNQKSNVEN